MSLQEELWLAIEEVRTSGNFLHEAAHDYTMDVLASRKREGMEGRAADLLKAVTRLLVLIDLIDINELFKASSRVSNKHTCTNNGQTNTLNGCWISKLNKSLQVHVKPMILKKRMVFFSWAPGINVHVGN